MFCECFKTKENFEDIIIPADDIEYDFNCVKKLGYNLFCYENIEKPDLNSAIPVEIQLVHMWNLLSVEEKKKWS